MFTQKAVETKKAARSCEPLWRFVAWQAVRREQLGRRLASIEPFLAGCRTCQNYSHQADYWPSQRSADHRTSLLAHPYERPLIAHSCAIVTRAGLGSSLQDCCRNGTLINCHGPNVCKSAALALFGANVDSSTRI